MATYCFKGNGVSWCRDNLWDATINDDVGNLGNAVVLNPTSGDLRNMTGVMWMCVGATEW